IDVYLFHQGTNYYSGNLLGCHHITWEEKSGFRFVVWAPHATSVSVTGDFNKWCGKGHELRRITDQGLWAGFFTNIPSNAAYKYKIVAANNQILLKADPYARQTEVRSKTGSLTPSLEQDYQWQDAEWQVKKKTYNPYQSPINIYEVHPGSWKKKETGE